MRVQELAELGATTTRTIRYYHQLGLLPVPSATDGIRDYQIEHLARLLRIRRLTEAGMSLATIAEVLGDKQIDAASTGSDLAATLAAIDTRMAELAQQRVRVLELIERDQRGEGLGPLPAGLRGVLDAIAAEMPTEQGRRLAENERNLINVLGALHLVPDSVERLVDQFDDQHRRWAAQMLIGLDELAAAPSPQTAAQIEQLRRQAWAFIDQRLPMIEALLRGARQDDPSVWTRFARLCTIAYPHPNQRAFGQLIAGDVQRHPVLSAAVR